MITIYYHYYYYYVAVLQLLYFIIITITISVITTIPGQCGAGWTGNQVVAGVLLQTTRRLVTHSCTQRFDKFTTVCTEQQLVYDVDTGQAVVVPRSSGGSAPYGVDAVFLTDSSAYDDAVVVGEYLSPSSS